LRILSLLFFIVFIFAKPLSINEAFKTKFIPQKNGVEFVVDMAKGVHIYKNKFKVFVNNKEIKLSLPPAKKDMFGSILINLRFLFLQKVGK